jgi:hypothetical protein
MEPDREQRKRLGPIEDPDPACSSLAFASFET